MVNGALFVIPLGLLIYVSAKVFVSLQHLLKPLAEGIGAEHFLGKFTLAIFTALFVLLFCYALGLLLRRAAVLVLVSETIEGLAVRFLPSLGFLKSMAVEKLHVETSTAWKGILFQDGDNWLPAFLIEENEQWLTIFIPEAPKGDGGEVRISARDSVTLKEIGLSAVRSSFRVYGAGLIEKLDR